MSRAIVCRGPGVQPLPGANFAVHEIFSSHRDHEGSGKSKSPLPGGLPSPDHPGTSIHHFSSIRCSARPFSHVQGNRVQGSGGATPGQRRTSLFVIPSLRTWRVKDLENRAGPCLGAGCPIDLWSGQGRGNHAGMPIHHFSSTDAPPTITAYPGQSPPARR